MFLFYSRSPKNCLLNLEGKYTCSWFAVNCKGVLSMHWLGYAVVNTDIEEGHILIAVPEQPIQPNYMHSGSLWSGWTSAWRSLDLPWYLASGPAIWERTFLSSSLASFFCFFPLCLPPLQKAVSSNKFSFCFSFEATQWAGRDWPRCLQFFFLKKETAYQFWMTGSTWSLKIHLLMG